MHKSMNLEKKLLDRLKVLHSQRKINDLADRSGVEQSAIARAVPREDGKKTQNLGLDKVSMLLEAMGAMVIFPDEIDEPSKRESNIITSQGTEDAISTLQREKGLLEEIISLQKEKIATLERGNSAYSSNPRHSAAVKITGQRLSLPTVSEAEPPVFSSYLPPEKADALLRIYNDIVAHCPEFLRTWLYGVEQMLLTNIPNNDELQGKLDSLASIRWSAVIEMLASQERPPQ